MSPQSFIFMGRYGSGKGTQANLLIQALKKKYPSTNSLHIETGNEFRKFIKEPTHLAQMTKSVIESGRLMPEFMCVYMWSRFISENYTGSENLIFDGTPRKLLEAKMLDAVFSFFNLSKPWLIYLDVDHEESGRRISLRATVGGRVDDGEEQLKKRKIAYETDILPTIEGYRTNPTVNFLDIDGARSIQEIHANIVKRVGL